jgi:hypothetical protein
MFAIAVRAGGQRLRTCANYGEAPLTIGKGTMRERWMWYSSWDWILQTGLLVRFRNIRSGGDIPGDKAGLAVIRFYAAALRQVK